MMALCHKWVAALIPHVCYQLITLAPVVAPVWKNKLDTRAKTYTDYEDFSRR